MNVMTRGPVRIPGAVNQALATGLYRPHVIKKFESVSDSEGESLSDGESDNDVLMQKGKHGRNSANADFTWELNGLLDQIVEYANIIKRYYKVRTEISVEAYDSLLRKFDIVPNKSNVTRDKLNAVKEYRDSILLKVCEKFNVPYPPNQNRNPAGGARR